MAGRGVGALVVLHVVDVLEGLGRVLKDGAGVLGEEVLGQVGDDDVLGRAQLGVWACAGDDLHCP